MKTLLLSLFCSTVVVLGALGGVYLSAAPPRPAVAGAPRPHLKLPLVAPSSPPPIEANVIQLEPLRIVGRAAKPRPASATAELVPCSDWRPIGPVYALREGEPVRERHVQMLCAGGASR